MKFSYYLEDFRECPPTVTDDGGKPVPLQAVIETGKPQRIEVNLAPGIEMNLNEAKLVLRPASEIGNERPIWRLFGAGKFQLQCDRAGRIIQDPKNGPGSILSKLATGKLELEVKEAPAPALSLPGVPTGLAPAKKQKVLTPEEAIKIAGDSKLAKEFNENKPAVEFKVQFVTKSILIQAAGDKKDAGWVHGHSPDDVCLGMLVYPMKAGEPGNSNHTRVVAILTTKAIKQFNKAGIDDMEKHFKGATVRVTGPISKQDYRGKGSAPEVEIVIDDLSQIEVVK